jgi:membrane protein implicated in regulation of membrane protease activity
MRAPPAWLAIGLLGIAAGAAYLPDVGRGFIKDDFGWIVAGRVERLGDLGPIFRRPVGFYRPLVTLTFAADRALFGLQPFPYGCTNLALLLLAAGLLVRLGTRLGLSRGLATLVGALWTFNFHGVNMAVLWVSGRTALVLTACAVAAALALVAGRRAAAGGLTLLALLAKEEAVALPVILGTWAWLYGGTRGLTRPARIRQWVADVWPLALALAAYALLRAQTEAYLPWRAPDYYRLTLAPDAVGRNLLEYLDRAGTVALAVVALACLVAGRVTRLAPRERRIALMGAIWLVGGFALTLFLPVRSSLYAVFPSVGAALVAGAAVAALEPDLRSRAWAIWLLLLLPFLCLPVYRVRNAPWRALAEVSADALGTLTTAARDLSDGDGILLLDDRASRASLANTFGVAAEEAVNLVTGRALRVWIEPPVRYAELAGLRPLRRQEARAIFRLEDGRLVKEAL